MKSNQMTIQTNWQPEPAKNLVAWTPVEEGKRSFFQEEILSGFSMIRSYTPQQLRRIGRYARKRMGDKRR